MGAEQHLHISGIALRPTVLVAWAKLGWRSGGSGRRAGGEEEELGGMWVEGGQAIRPWDAAVRPHLKTPWEDTLPQLGLPRFCEVLCAVSSVLCLLNRCRSKQTHGAARTSPGARR